MKSGLDAMPLFLLDDLLINAIIDLSHILLDVAYTCIINHYLISGLRDMFRENFEQLQLRLYQLDRLIEANLPDLHVHFQDQGKN